MSSFARSEKRNNMLVKTERNIDLFFLLVIQTHNANKNSMSDTPPHTEADNHVMVCEETGFIAKNKIPRKAGNALILNIRRSEYASIAEIV